MHSAANHSLLHYHFGGDEVPADAWKGSPICQQFMEDMGFVDNSDLKRYFFETVLNASFGTCVQFSCDFGYLIINGKLYWLSVCGHVSDGPHRNTHYYSCTTPPQPPHLPYHFHNCLHFVTVTGNV